MRSGSGRTCGAALTSIATRKLVDWPISWYYWKMPLPDLLATRNLRPGLADAGQALVYLRQLLRGDRVPAVASTTPPRPGSNDGAPQAPVLLVHGYLANRGSLHLLEQRMHALGHVVLSYRLGLQGLGDIRAAARKFALKVDALLAQTGVARADIVGHSMGGLLALYYLKRLGGAAKVRRLVMLGAPIHGTWSALLGLPALPLGRAGLQLLPASDFLRELGEGPMPTGVDIVSVTAERDFLAPVASTLLEGVRQIRLPTSHSGLLVDPQVATTLDHLLRHGRAAITPAFDAQVPSV